MHRRLCALTSVVDVAHRFLDEWMTFGTQPQAGSTSTLESVRFIEVAQGQPQVVGSEGVVAAPYDSLQKCMCESVVTTVGVP